MISKYRPTAIIVRSLRFSVILLSILNTSCVSIKPKTTNLLLDCTFEKYYAFHDVELVNTNITKELMVNGTLIAANSKLNKVSMNGKATLNNSVVSGELSLNGTIIIDKTVVKSKLIGNGELEAYNAQICKIDMSAQKIILNDTIVGNIRIRDHKNSIIYLQNGSTVTGDVVFDTGYGTVMVDKSSRVKGSISGKYIQKNMLQINIGHKNKRKK